MTTSNTGTRFFNWDDDKSAYTDGTTSFKINKAKELCVEQGDHKDVITPKNNAYGRFYVLTLDNVKYFASERENSKGDYLMLKVAADKPQAAAAPAADQTVAAPAKPYGKRA